MVVTPFWVIQVQIMAEENATVLTYQLILLIRSKPTEMFFKNMWL